MVNSFRILNKHKNQGLKLKGLGLHGYGLKKAGLQGSNTKVPGLCGSISFAQGLQTPVPFLIVNQIHKSRSTKFNARMA